MSGIAFLCIVSALAFLVALVGALRVPRKAAGSAAKLLLSFAMLVYLFASVSNVLEHTGVSSGLDPFEDYAEILLFPFLLYFIHALRVRQEFDRRERAENAYRKAEAEKATILDSLVEYVVLHDLDMGILWANRAACESVGLSPEEVVGRFCYALWHQRQDSCPGCPVVQAMEHGHPAQTEKATPDGRAWFIRGYPVYGGDGQVAGGIEVALEITERKRAEDALRQSERSLATTLDSIGDAVVVTDTEGVVVRMNPVAEALTEWPLAEARGRDIADVVHLIDPTTRQPVESLVPRVLRQGVVLGLADESVMIARGGAERRLTDSGAPIRNEQGETIGVVLVFRDVTERHGLEQQLRHMHKMEAIGQLAGGIAHDLNNMLLPMLGYTDIALRRVPKEDPLHDDLAQIHEAAERARDLTRGLLAFGRKQVLDMRVLDLNRVVAGFERMLHRAVREDIEIVIRLDGAQSLVKADQAQIEQILLNLTINARDAMPDGGTLSIETSHLALTEQETRALAGVAPGSYVVLTVRDDGVGMDAQTMPRIFEPFFTTKEIDKGTGLGLSTVYGIVKQHNGEIRVDSQAGRGTTLWVYLPEAAEAPLPEPDRGVDLAGARGTETILIVEDEALVRKLTARLLAQYGYRVLQAAGAAEALRTASQHDGAIHLLLTDVIMPGMNGKELRQRFAETRPDAKVLFTSGHPQDIIAHHGILDPDVHFLEKPFTVEQLTAKVREALDS